MDTSGTITQVVDSGGGITIPNTKAHGSSRIRGYASLNTDRIGLNTGDYKTNSEISSCQAGSRQLQVIKLCSCRAYVPLGKGICRSCNRHLT